MAEKHVVICDHCGKEGNIRSAGLLDNIWAKAPVGWVAVFTVGDGYELFCSKACVVAHISVDVKGAYLDHSPS